MGTLTLSVRMVNVLIVDHFEAEFLAALEIVKEARIQYKPAVTRTEVLSALSAYEVLIIKSKTTVDETLLAGAPNLKLIIRAGVGLENIDEAACAARGIQVHNTPGANADAVGDHALGMLLGLMNNLYRANAQVKQFVWEREPNRGHELRGKTVGIIGYGHTGSAVARRLQGFGVQVLAYDKYKTGFGNRHVEEAELKDIYTHADVLTLHVPFTAETHHLVNARYLENFKKPIWLLNLSRGSVVHTLDLIEALQQGRVLGAALDVLENEQMDALTLEQRANYEMLFAMENVVLSPHIGGWSYESAQQVNDACIAMLHAYLSTRKT